jgi:hypothetical protein
VTRTQPPNGMDMATWLRVRAERRGQRGVVAGYVHELTTRHRIADNAPGAGAAERGGHLRARAGEAA